MQCLKSVFHGSKLLELSFCANFSKHSACLPNGGICAPESILSFRSATSKELLIFFEELAWAIKSVMAQEQSQFLCPRLQSESFGGRYEIDLTFPSTKFKTKCAKKTEFSLAP